MFHVQLVHKRCYSEHRELFPVDQRQAQGCFCKDTLEVGMHSNALSLMLDLRNGIAGVLILQEAYLYLKLTNTFALH